MKTPYTDNNEFNELDFVITRYINKINTIMIVQVLAVLGDELTIVPMTYDNDKLTKQIKPPTPIYGVPYITLQGGGNAIKIKPQMGDIGLALVCMRDVSAVKKNKGLSTVGSERKYNKADAIYLGGLLNRAPIRYIELANTGITIDSGLMPIDITTTTATIVGDMKVQGDLSCTGTCTLEKLIVNQSLKAGGVEHIGHTHPYAWTDGSGAGSTGPAVG